MIGVILFISTNYDTELSLTGERGITKSATQETLKSGGPYGRVQEEWTRRQDYNVTFSKRRREHPPKGNTELLVKRG